MADAVANRGRGRGKGKGRGRGVDPTNEVPADNQPDQRELEIAEMNRRIRELEHQLTEARMGSATGG